MQVQLGGHPNPNPNPLTTHPNPNHAQVQLGGVNIMGAPFQAVVLPGRTDARHSTAHGDGLRLSVAGVPASFTIVAADAFGNERSVCGDNFQVHGAPVSRIPNLPPPLPLPLTQVSLSGPALGRSRTRVHGLVSERGRGRGSGRGRGRGRGS